MLTLSSATHWSRQLGTKKHPLSNRKTPATFTERGGGNISRLQAVQEWTGQEGVLITSVN